MSRAEAQGLRLSWRPTGIVVFASLDTTGPRVPMVQAVSNDCSYLDGGPSRRPSPLGRAFNWLVGR